MDNDIMEAISYSNARARFARIMDQVNRDRDGIIITRQNGASAVLMSLEDYESWQATLHLLRSPANARRLLDSLAGAGKGKARVRKLADLK
jgi:antitoxin YefM